MKSWCKTEGIYCPMALTNGYCQLTVCIVGKYYPKETEIDWKKEFEDMVRYIGVIDYGKERWFMETEKSGRVRWYDRYDGEYLTTDELQQRIYEVVRKLDE